MPHIGFEGQAAHQDCSASTADSAEQSVIRLLLKVATLFHIDHWMQINCGMILPTLHGPVQTRVSNLILQSTNGTLALKVDGSMVQTHVANTCSSMILLAT